MSELSEAAYTVADEFSAAYTVADEIIRMSGLPNAEVPEEVFTALGEYAINITKVLPEPPKGSLTVGMAELTEFAACCFLAGRFIGRDDSTSEVEVTMTGSQASEFVRGLFTNGATLRIAVDTE